MSFNVPTIADLIRDRRARALLPKNVDLQGWNADNKVFDDLVERTKPKVILEVGSWKGASTAHLAKVSEKFGSHIYCVDPWLWLRQEDDENGSGRDLLGTPLIYNQFIRNFVGTGAASRIHPLRNTSMAMANIFNARDVRAELIYIDGPHEYDEAYMDVKHYSRLLAPGGIIFGDDWPLRGVFAAVVRYSTENNLGVETVDGQFWILRKP